MTTVREICTRALRRPGIVDQIDNPSAEAHRDALAALNEMMWGWHARGINTLMQADWGLDDTFAFFVPPVVLTAETIDVLDYRGTWDASTNSPALATAVGTKGYAYKVSTAGSTTLDDVSSWALNDYAVFDGTEWLKSLSSERLHSGITAMLALRMCDDYAIAPSPVLVASAADAWTSLQPYYVKPPTAQFDKALTSMPSRTRAVSFEEL